jgi:hypothetical protein
VPSKNKRTIGNSSASGGENKDMFSTCVAARKEENGDWHRGCNTKKKHKMVSWALDLIKNQQNNDAAKRQHSLSLQQ